MIMNHPHHHHPHHHHPHAHAGVAIGPLPNPCIGMVAAPTAAGPVLAGIGVPIMTAAAPTLVPPPPTLPPAPHNHSHSHQQAAQHQHSVHNGKKLVMSPDSSDDKDKCGVHPFIQARTSPSGATVVSCSAAVSGAGNQLTWSSAPLQATPTGAIMPAGIAYPVMGLPPGALTAEPNAAAATGMIYGVSIADHQVSAGVNSVIPIPTSGSAIVTPVQQPLPPTISISSVIAPQTSQPGSTTIPIPTSGVGTTVQQQQQPTKEIIHCKSCTLFPPNPSAPPATTRDRPPGCRTAFVGGLPEKMSEDIVREIFERCGEITTIRMSKKNFCHIRFEMEEFVELALYLSGYRIRIGSNSDNSNIGRLHVDYAQARDDLYEWECRQRQLLREQRHRERLQQERLCPSPPPTVHFSDHEAANVAERIKGDDTFMKAIQIILNWLEKGECLKRNSNTFYSMIQSTNSQIRRLLNEKSQYEDDFQRAKDLMGQRVTGLLMQFTQIEKVFSAACQRKVWDHFSKAQRKNIEVWKKQVLEIKSVLLEEALNERADEEMEFSDLESDSSGHSNKENGEPPRAKKMRLTGEDTVKTVHQLKEENDALRCQLEASKNEVDLIKADLRTELEMKDQQLRSLQQQFMDIQNSSCSSSPTPILLTTAASCPSSTSINPTLTGSFTATGSSSSLSTPSSTMFAKQMLPSPPVSVSSSSSSPAFGLSPTNNSSVTATSQKGSSVENARSIVENKDNNSSSSPPIGNKSNSNNNSDKDIQGFCDSSSSSNNISNNPNNINAPLTNQQSAQSNHHNHHHSNNNSKSENAIGVIASTPGCTNNSNVNVGTNGDDNHHENLMGAPSLVIDSNNTNSSGVSPHQQDQNLIIGINEKEAKLLGVISTFLHVHPFGASLDYIWSYAQKVLPMVRPNQIEVLMTKFPTLFKQEVSGIGATFERKWIFVGFL